VATPQEQTAGRETVAFTWVAVGEPRESRTEHIDCLARFGEKVIG
jgi:hypothetical protein